MGCLGEKAAPQQLGTERVPFRVPSARAFAGLAVRRGAPFTYLSIYLSICVCGVVVRSERDGGRIHGVGTRRGEECGMNGCCGSGVLSRGVLEEVPRWVHLFYFGIGKYLGRYLLFNNCDSFSCSDTLPTALLICLFTFVLNSSILCWRNKRERAVRTHYTS